MDDYSRLGLTAELRYSPRGRVSILVPRLPMTIQTGALLPASLHDGAADEDQSPSPRGSGRVARGVGKRYHRQPRRRPQ